MQILVNSGGSDAVNTTLAVGRAYTVHHFDWLVQPLLKVGLGRCDSLQGSK
jgi:hypothetical protein